MTVFARSFAIRSIANIKHLFEMQTEPTQKLRLQNQTLSSPTEAGDWPDLLCCLCGYSEIMVSTTTHDADIGL